MQLFASLAVVLSLSGPLTRAALESFTYNLGDSSSVEGGKVPLVQGRWSDPQSGGTFTLHPVHAIGDVDGDGNADGVAIVVEATGGSGTFYYMFALANREGRLVQLGEPEWLGDRTVVRGVSIDRDGTITVRYVTHGDNDPACCPTMKIEDRYRVKDGRLVGILK